MGYDSDNASEDDRDEDEDDDFEEAGRGDRLLGFMFGNVDNSGDLDVDYLDEDAKEHLAALADKLGQSLTEIDLSVKTSQTPADTADQDYDKKAEDAVDFEDIDEQYEGPETQGATEEDHLLPKKEYFSAMASGAMLQTTSVFDDENYDEDEETEVEPNSSQVQSVSLSGEQAEVLTAAGQAFESPLDDLQVEFLEEEKPATDLGGRQEEPDILEAPCDSRSSIPLPILCIEDGTVILRFSEIFGVQKPLKEREHRIQEYDSLREKYKPLDAFDCIEDDEEEFLKVYNEGVKRAYLAQDDGATLMVDEPETGRFCVVEGVAAVSHEGDQNWKDNCFSAQAMKEDAADDLSVSWHAPLCPEFYPLDQQDWEDRIVWDNSPALSDHLVEKSYIHGPGYDILVRDAALNTSTGAHMLESNENDCRPFIPNLSVFVESFDSTKSVDDNSMPPVSRSHPQLLRLESRSDLDATNLSDVKRHFSKVSLQNRDILDGSWLEKIIWDPNKPVSKPKLILDLQDEQMLFEVVDVKDAKHLRLHAGAMIITHPVKHGVGQFSELPGHVGQSGGRFNIANDKFYSNRKTTQQMKSHSKKHSAHGIKVLHSIPAVKLQTMKPKLSNKDIAHFHRPKALWYPHDNEVAMKEQRKLPTCGPMKVLLKSLGGKGSRLHVDVEETVSSLKAKASKKLDFKVSEDVKIFFSGKELEDHKSLGGQNVHPNSLLHLVRTKIHFLPRAQKLPGGNRSLRPPGAFKKKSDLSVKDGHVFLMEYCEERPLLLGNIGMGARLCTYYQKSGLGDQMGTQLRNQSSSLGTVLILDPADKSPFLGEIQAGCSQSCLETNMYRAPIFQHKVPSTDYLLVRSAKGKLSIRRIDRIDVVGQQEPHMEVMSPGSKGVQSYMINRLLVYMYREFRALEKRGLLPCIRADEISAQFPNISESFLRKRLKHCAELQRSNGEFYWIMRNNYRIPLEEELRRIVTPENVCAYESMLAGLCRLKRLGITRLTHPNGLSTAMNQLPDEAITLAAASHIERELQITPWNLSCNFVACTNQDRENIERLEITGVGDPSGRGLGFSYVRSVTKAPISSTVSKKKAPIGRGNSTVTGTDADLRRLSMEAAREVLLKFHVPDEQIAKQTRWHRIAMIRKLSSEQAAAGVKVDPTSISKFARGQRMSFLQLQQQTREKCQEIWDRQCQSLLAVDGDENESDSEANSDLDSFAGDLENLLDAEECEDEEVGDFESKHDKIDSVRGLKMRRHHTQAQAEEEIEDEAAEAAELCRMLMDDDETDWKKKKRTKSVGKDLVTFGGSQASFGVENADRGKKPSTYVKQDIVQPHGVYISNANISQHPTDVEGLAAKKLIGKAKRMKKLDSEELGLLNKKVKIMGDGVKIIKEKKSARDSFTCGACGQLGHMRTNKNCPKYGEDPETQTESAEPETVHGKSNLPDSLAQSQQKPQVKKLVQKNAMKPAPVETPEGEDSSSKAKILPVKFKCGPAEKATENLTIGDTSTLDQLHSSQGETANISITKVSKIIISNKTKPEDAEVEFHKPSVVIKPPAETDKEQHRKKIIIKRPKEISSLDEARQDGSPFLEYRKTKKMVELSTFEKRNKLERLAISGETTWMNPEEDNRWWEEEEKRRSVDRQREESRRRRYEDQRMLEEQERLAEIRRYEEAIRREREEEMRQKEKKKKKKKKLDIKEDYLEDFRARRNWLSERERISRRRSVAEAARNSDHAPPAKRRRGGEVGLSNILEGIVEALKRAHEVSYLFLKPVSKKEAPDYLDIIENPMDLSTIKERVRKLEYKHRDEFRHDVWQIAYNAHKYNDGRNPGIPPLADQLLEICEYLLEEHGASLMEAEASIEH